eukprot:4525823-Pyramimonas_sp.AAC.2
MRTTGLHQAAIGWIWQNSAVDRGYHDHTPITHQKRWNDDLERGWILILNPNRSELGRILTEDSTSEH